MAVNIGFFFLKKGYPVHWLSHSKNQLQLLEKKIIKSHKRLKRFFPEQAASFRASCSGYGSNIPQPEIIYESSREDLEIKRAIFNQLNHLVSNNTLLLSNSSSILPSSIHPRCLGAHLFFPVELTSLVELICCNSTEKKTVGKAHAFFKENGIDLISQDEQSAFTINRLLLPLQAFSFMALQNGFSPEEVDQASKSELIGHGQLSLMDSIGLDVVQAAANNYHQLNSSIFNPDFDILLSSLEQLLDMNKMGMKNKDGLLIGQELPWSIAKKNKKSLHQLHKQFKQLLIDSIQSALQQKLVSGAELVMIMDRIFHATSIPDFLPSSN